MASGPITSREIDGETVETVSGFIFLGSKISADRVLRRQIGGVVFLFLEEFSTVCCDPHSQRL